MDYRWSWRSTLTWKKGLLFWQFQEYLSFCFLRRTCRSYRSVTECSSGSSCPQTVQVWGIKKLLVGFHVTRGFLLFVCLAGLISRLLYQLFSWSAIWALALGPNYLFITYPYFLIVGPFFRIFWLGVLTNF